MKLRKKIGLLVLFSMLLSLVTPWQAEVAEAAQIQVPVYVTWTNADGSPMAPADIPTVDITLLQDHNDFVTYHSTPANPNHVFNNVELVRPDGTSYDYQVVETYNGGVQVGHDGTLLVDGKNYRIFVTGDLDNGFKVNNVLQTPVTPNKTVDITVVKNWVGQTPNLPNGLNIKLYRDGNEVNAFSLVAGSQWTATFSNQPRYDNLGHEYTYTVKEVDKSGNPVGNGGVAVIADYSAPVATDITYDVAISEPALDAGQDPNATVVRKHATITNTKQGTNPQPPIGNTKTITVEKIWKDANGTTITAAPYPEASATIELLQNGQSLGTVEVNQATKWRGYFYNMPIRDAAGVIYDYSVREVGAVGSVYTGARSVSYEVTLREVEAESFFEVVNKKQAGGPQADQKRLYIQKTWTVEPSADVENIRVEVYGKTNQPVAVPILLGEVYVKRTDKWLAYVDVPLKNAAGEEYVTYSYKEVNEVNGEIILGGKTYQVRLNPNPNGVTILNDDKVPTGYTSSSTFGPQVDKNKDKQEDKDKDKDKDPSTIDQPKTPEDPTTPSDQGKSNDQAKPGDSDKTEGKDKPDLSKDKASKPSPTEVKVGKAVPKTGLVR